MTAHHVGGAGTAVAQAVAVGIGDHGVGGIAPEHLGRVQEPVVVGVGVEGIGGDGPTAGDLMPIVPTVVVGIPVCGCLLYTSPSPRD